jgi:hypothetical protein
VFRGLLLLLRLVLVVLGLLSARVVVVELLEGGRGRGRDGMRKRVEGTRRGTDGCMSSCSYSKRIVLM